MKSVLYILNGILLILVGVLFYLHFKDRKSAGGNTTPTVLASTAKKDTGAFRIAYFELDSITDSYKMVKDVKEELSQEEVRMTRELNDRQNQLNATVRKYQGQKNMSQVESEQAMSKVEAMQAELANRKQELNQKYQDIYRRKFQDVKGKIEEFLKKYNSNGMYSYIFSYEPGFIYYRDPMYNITDDLLKGLNAEYDTQKKEKK